MSTTEINTGTDLVRLALRGRNKKLNLAVMAKDLSMSNERLDAFANGKLTLDAATMQALVKVLWNGHAEFDVEHDALTPANKAPPTSLGVKPAPYVAKDRPKLPAGPHMGPRPVVPQPAKAKTTRPGWLGNFF